MNEPDYMPALLTGLIGLLGVIIGGTINVVAQRRKAVEDQVWELRRECAALAKAATDYSATMAQFVHTANKERQELEEATSETELEEAKVDQEYWDRLTEGLFENFGETFEASLQLFAAKDARIAEQAGVLHHAVVDVHNEVAPVLLHEAWVATDRAEELREKVNTEANMILGMVEPRWYETFIRFRRRKTVVKRQEKEQKKKADKDDKN